MHQFTLQTQAKNQFINIDDQVRAAIDVLKIQDGVLTVFCPHTTAGLTINENADSAVQWDMLKTLNKLIPVDSNYEHAEGNSDAHLKSSLVGVTLQLFVVEGKLKLGPWQSVYFCEFDGPRERNVWVID